MILIPVKDLSRAKQRLAPVLDQSARTALAQAMLTDVLQVIASANADDVALVTSDPFASELAQHYRFSIIPDESNLSETDAIQKASRVCESRGIETTVVLPGDIPLIQSADIHALYDSAPASGSVLVPSRDKRGTNAVLRRPASLFPLRFGNDSFIPHLAAAVGAERACVVLSLPGIALDIDTADDLHHLALSPGATTSQALARVLGFGRPSEIAAAANSHSAEQRLASAKA
jgi:2-phospho-L-lactate guanylyltransferase